MNDERGISDAELRTSDAETDFQDLLPVRQIRRGSFIVPRQSFIVLFICPVSPDSLEDSRRKELRIQNLKSGNFSKTTVNKRRNCLRPVGTVDNSPPFERWVHAETSGKVPEGRQIKAFHVHLSSLRDSNLVPPVTRR
jgi:hypothetical protein